MGRKPRPRPAARPERPPSHDAPWRLPVLLFLLALTVRVVAWRATPDAAWPYSALYKGDALVFLEQARELQHGRAPELGLPIHPPGTARLLALTWSGESAGFSRVRLLWVLLGAFSVPLLYLAAAPTLGPRVAAVAAGALATLHGSVVLALSPCSEAPASVLVLAALALAPRVRGRLELPGWALYGLLLGLACLFRVELRPDRGPAAGLARLAGPPARAAARRDRGADAGPAPLAPPGLERAGAGQRRGRAGPRAAAGDARRLVARGRGLA